MTTPTVVTSSPVVLALDTPDLDEARRWAAQAGAAVGMVKVGLELWCAQGPAAVRALTGPPPAAGGQVGQAPLWAAGDIPGSAGPPASSGGPTGDAEPAAGHRVMLDLKLHDIPNTVAGAVAAVADLADLGVELLTVHATGGRRMLQAAVQAAAGRVQVAAVTLLTSLDAGESARLGGPDAVTDLAAAAVDCGCRAVVCSPLEAAAVRAAVGPDVRIICPGVRPASPSAAGGAGDDQRRVATPAEAIAAGADLLVVGRPITAAADIAAAAAAIRDAAARARPER